MKDEYLSPLAHYEEQAQRIRRLAVEAHSLETRDQFLALAEQYERLAGQAARRAPSDERARSRY